MGLVVIGLNHETATLSAREHAVYSQAEAMDTLKSLRRDCGASQALLLSTCNRTELYALVAEPESAAPLITNAVFAQRMPGEDISRFIYRRDEEDAVRHLFRVAAGLDSQVLGEQEILGQVKTAYEVSAAAESAGTVFHRLASRAFRVGKRARSETRIGVGAMSVAYAAVELAEKVFQSLAGRGVLLMGAGENGALCAQHLVSRRVSPLLITNRTDLRSADLARTLGGTSVPWEQRNDAMARVDVVVTTTGSPKAILELNELKQIMRRRGDRSLVLIDIAVPRDINPDVDSLHNVFRFDLEALNGVVDQNVEHRREEVPAVERLVEREVAGFMQWWGSLASAPVIADLHGAFDHIRANEVHRNAKRFRAEDREQLEVFTRSLVQKLLLDVTTEIKQYRSDRPMDLERLATLRRAFHLGEHDAPDESEDEHFA